MKSWAEVIDGIRNAIHGKEVREDIAQMGEYVEQFANTAGENIKKAIDPTLSLSGKAADARETGKKIDYEKSRATSAEAALENKKANKTDLDTERKRIDILNDGGLNLKDEVIDTSIKTWLTDHPEATTTVQDGAITEPKIRSDFLLKIENEYVTPEMFGAKCDGIYDDAIAINLAIAEIKKSGSKTKTLLLRNAVYTLKTPIDLSECRNIKIRSNAMTSMSNDSTILRCYETSAFIFDHTVYCAILGINIWTENADSAFSGIYYHDSNKSSNLSRNFGNIFQNVKIYGFYYGVKIETGSGYEYFNDCYISSCNIGIGIGIDYKEASGKISPNYIYLEKVKFSGCEVCADIHNGEYIFMHECDFVDGIGVRVIKNSVNNLSVENNVFFACTFPVYATAPVNYSAIINNMIRLTDKNNNGVAIESNGIYVHPKGNCSNLRVINQYRIVKSTHSGYLAKIENVSDYIVDCNYPYNYDVTSFPIQGGTPTNYKDLIGRTSVVHKISSGYQNYTVSFKGWIAPKSFELVRMSSTALIANGTNIRMINQTISGTTLNFSTNETESEITGLLIPLY